MNVTSSEAEGQLVGIRFPNKRCACRNQPSDGGGVLRSGSLVVQPVWVSAAGTQTSNIDQILDGKGKASEWSTLTAWYLGLSCV